MSDLYVRLETFSGDWYYAKYDDFNVANESDGYRLRLKVGSYKGNAGTLSVLQFFFNTLKTWNKYMSNVNNNCLLL